VEEERKVWDCREEAMVGSCSLSHLCPLLLLVDLSTINKWNSESFFVCVLFLVLNINDEVTHILINI